MAITTILKRKALEVFEKQEQSSKRTCIDHGIKFADVQALFEDDPVEDSGYSSGDDSELTCGAPYVGSPSDHVPQQNPFAAYIAERSGHHMITRRTTKAYLYNAVFNTGELLEQIIYQLPPASIVNLRRVNKTWNHIITTLPCIRRKIFLDAEPLKDLWIYDADFSILQPYTEDLEVKHGMMWAFKQQKCTPSVFNPMLFKRDDRAEQVPLHARAQLCESLRFTACPDLQLDTSGFGSSIYHKMFVCQPPVRFVEYSLWFHDRNIKDTEYACRLRIDRAGGVRFGDILDSFKRGYRVIVNPVTMETRDIRPMFDTNTGAPKDISLRIAGNTQKKCAVWMSGAIYVTDEEEQSIEKLRPEPIKTQYSLQAQEQIKENNGKLLDFRPTPANFVDKPHRVRGEPPEVIDLTGEETDDEFADEDESTDDECDNKCDDY